MRAAALVLVVCGLASPAGAFIRSRDSGTQACLYWTKREVPWVLNQSGSADVGFGELEAALQRSFDAWEDVSCSDLTFRYDGNTPRFDTGIDTKNPENNLNILTFREKTCALAAPANDPCFTATPRNCRSKYDCWQNSTGIIALTTASFSRSTGVILDADIEFNGSVDSSGSEFRFTAGLIEGPTCTKPTDVNCVASDIQNTATHEIGHFFGLDHPPVPEATMFASAPAGETKKRSLDADDIDGICEIYPKGGRTKLCTPTGWMTLEPVESDLPLGCANARLPGAAAALVLVLLAHPRRARRRAPAGGS